MDRLLSYSRPSRRLSFQSNIMTFVNCVLCLVGVFGLSTLWSCSVDAAFDQVHTAIPRQRSSYHVMGVEGANQPKVVLVPVKFDELGFATAFIDSHHFPLIGSTNSGQRGSVMPTIKVLQEPASVIDNTNSNDKESHPFDTSRISFKEPAMVAKVRKGVLWRLSWSAPWLLDRSVTFLVGASLLLLLGALILKKALEKAHRWDHQLQVDSLAYDLAYTDTRSYPGYGSFVSPASLHEFDRFDV